MADVQITGSAGYGECDDCGFYEWEQIIVKVDGVRMLDHSGDTHLGGAVWYNWEQAVSDVLRAMGHTVTIDIQEGD